MPKVTTSQSARQTKLVVFTDSENVKRVLVPLPKTYQAAIALAHRHFPYIAQNAIVLATNELDICRGEHVFITDTAWDEVILHISRFIVVSNPESDNLSEPKAVQSGIQSGSSGSQEKITITVMDCEGRQLSAKLRLDSPLAKLLNAWELQYGSYGSGFRFTFDGGCVTPRYTPRELRMENGDVIDATRHAVGGKPVIYLFSPEEMKVDVKLSLVHQWDFSAIYPVVPIKSTSFGEEIAWTVTTHVGGSLTEVSSGLEVSYLFWEAHTNKTIPASPPPSPTIGGGNFEYFVPSEASVNPSNAILLTLDDLPRYLDKALALLGLHTEARTSFITYWLPSFNKHTHIAIRFLPQASYERAAPLAITPSPDIVTRVFLLFRGIEHDVLQSWKDCWAKQDDAEFAMWSKRVGIYLEKASDEKLFRVLEWGGMEVYV